MVADRGVSRLRRWSERHLIVGDGPRAGKPWRPGNRAWAGILDAIGDPEVHQVTVRGSVQAGKTATLIAAALGFFAAGKRVLILEPDLELKRALSARIRTWARLCGDASVSEPWERPRPPHERENAAGGYLAVLSAGARGSTLMRTAEVVIVDELRAFKRDILAELIDRMAAYGETGKLVTASSAGVEEQCKTTAELDKSDRRYWFASCPACGQRTPVEWKNVQLPKDGKKAPTYGWPCCGSIVSSRSFKAAVNAGEWRPTRAAAVAGTVGFHIDCFASPFETLPTIARMWQRAVVHRKTTGSYAEIRAFQMGRLALPFKPDPHQGVTAERLDTTCRADYIDIPLAASVVVGAVDVQGDRLEAELSAWGAVEVEVGDTVEGGYHGVRHDGRWFRLQRSALEYRRIVGDPGSAEVWNELLEFMETPRRHESGIKLRTVLCGIDSGGHHGSEVAEFCRVNGDAYIALKGLGERTHGGVLAKRSVTQDTLHDWGPQGLLIVNTNLAKETGFAMMRQSCEGVEPRPMSWPLDESRYGPLEFASICSETRERRVDKVTGHTTLRWVKIAKANEALDVLTYSLACVHYLGIGFVLSERDLIERTTSNEHHAIAA